MSGLFRWLRSGYILNTPSPSPAARIRYGTAPQNFADLRLPGSPGPHPVLVIIHGGFWRNRYSLEHIGHLAQALTSTSVATWTIEYRRIGDTGGAYPGTFLDVASAVAHLPALAEEYDLDLERVAAAGHSAGGHLALWLASAHRVPHDSPLYMEQPVSLLGAVSLAGVTDLRRAWDLRLSSGVVRDLMGGTPKEVPGRYAEASPIEMLPAGIKTILLHGTEDENVPFELSEHYARAAGEAGDPCELVALEGAAHFEVVDPMAKEFARVRETVHSLL